MQITRDVVTDLLTVYLAGEASTDTRALVEQWLRSDPELAERVARARQIDLPAVPVPAPTVERRALDRTRRVLRTRAVVLGTAIYFSMLPLSVTFNRDGFQGLLLDDWLSRSLALLVAAALWVTYWRQGRPLRRSAPSGSSAHVG
jgi:anti-sigma factor RsiW